MADSKVTLNEINASLIRKVGDILDDTNSISTRDGMKLQLEMTFELIKSHNEVIQQLRIQNGRVGRAEDDIADLKKRNIVLWITARPKTSLLIFAGVFIINSMINWAGVRRPLLYALLKHLGIDIPLDSIP